MVNVANPTFVGTNFDATWLVQETQSLQSALANNPVAHFATTTLICGALVVKENNIFSRIRNFISCQLLVNGALIAPSFLQNVLVEPKFVTLHKTADTIYKNIIVEPLSLAKEKMIDGSSWIADNLYNLNNFVINTLSPLIPANTIARMGFATKFSKQNPHGLTYRYGLAPICAAIFSNAMFTVPVMVKNLLGTPEQNGKSSFGQVVFDLANAWIKTGHLLVDLTHYGIESTKSTWKRMNA